MIDDVYAHMHSRRNFLKNVGLTIGCLAGGGHAIGATDGHSQKLNIIVILADDMGKDSVSAFNDKLGFKTPRIDKLAKEGIVFNNAHSNSAVCTPSRYGLLTGRYSWRSRLKGFILPKWDLPLIEKGRLTLPAMLKTEGYDTAMFGKWHLGWNWPFLSKQAIPTGKIKALREHAAEGIDWKQPITGGPCSIGFDYYFGDDCINQAHGGALFLCGAPHKNNYV